MLGRFLEISLHTEDIAASVAFYESLGFSQCATADTWPHPYGVLTDGRITVGLHQYKFPSPSLTYVREEIARHSSEFIDAGITLAFARTGDDMFNEIGFTDPSGQMVTVLEARTHFGSNRSAREESLCGYFAELSIPVSDFMVAREFWEHLGFVALEEIESPYLHVPLTSDQLDLALHRPGTLDRAALVFRDPAMPERVRELKERGVEFSRELPRGLDPLANALLQAPEGTPLLLLHEP